MLGQFQLLRVNLLRPIQIMFTWLLSKFHVQVIFNYHILGVKCSPLVMLGQVDLFSAILLHLYYAWLVRITWGEKLTLRLYLGRLSLGETVTPKLCEVRLSHSLLNIHVYVVQVEVQSFGMKL